jgi:hypothetical protein
MRTFWRSTRSCRGQPRGAAGTVPTRVAFDSDRGDYVAERRASNLARWHELLLDRLHGGEGADRIDRLVGHPALGGAPLRFVAARLAHRRGDVERAGALVRECLERLPGRVGYARFAQEIGIPLPSRTVQILTEQGRLRRPAVLAVGSVEKEIAEE